MKHKELILFLKDFLKVEPKQKDIALALYVNTNVISTRASRNSIYDIQEILKIGKYFNIPEEEILKEIILNFAKENNFNLQKLSNKDENSSIEKGNIKVDCYSEYSVSVKDGKYQISGKKETVLFPIKLINKYSEDKKYFLINAEGDSMQPEIKNGDKLIIEIFNNNKITDNQIYVFVYNNQIYIKRLVKNINQLSVISDNSDKTIYPTRYINNSEYENITIIGKIAGLIR